MTRSITGVRSERRENTGSARGTRLLRYAALVYAAGFALHNGDHLRRGFGAVTPQVLWTGNLSGIVVVAAIALALLGHRLAPELAVATGASMALGVSAVHLLPHWSAFSDSLTDAGADLFTWVAVLVEVGGSVLFAAAGLYALRHRSVPS